MASRNIVIRDIDRPDDIRAAEALQREVWGLPDLDVVPFTQLVAAKAAGGVLLGAFDDSVLAGFVYGFVGYENGMTTHHSHMLAVSPEYRSSNLGHALKLKQRETVLAQGIETMTWTFDPLQSLNAYFNFGKLGVRSDRYLVNFYGEDAASFLHRNGTDRLWVTWELNSPHVRTRLEGSVQESDSENVTAFVEVGEDDKPRYVAATVGRSSRKAIIEIPADINEIERKDWSIASQWREATRQAFTEALNNGYLVEGFYRNDRKEQRVGRYLLVSRETGGS